MHPIHTELAPKAIGPYSQAIVTDCLIFTSGQIPVDPATNTVVENDITVQTKQVLENLSRVLEAAGASTADVCKTTCFLQDMSDFAAFNAVYSEYFPNNPARSCVAVQTLPKNVLVEVEAVAVRR